MSGSQALTVQLFGESHGPNIGATITGLPAGLRVDMARVAALMSRRRSAGSVSTLRRETDEPKIISGLRDGVLTGTPVTVLFENADAHSEDYAFLPDKPRPGHADYPAYIASGGHADLRGGGHFSGRLTLGYLFAGALAAEYLLTKQIRIYGHLLRVGDVTGERLDALAPDETALMKARERPVCALSDALSARMIQAALSAKEAGDSLGGEIELCALGLPVGLGEPFFDGCEAVISHALFSVPAVKGVEFGAGFAAARMRGSAYNDPYRVREGRVCVSRNCAGGLLGGLTNGAPLIARCALRPTPSIGREQDTVSLGKMRNEKLTVTGRHDACVALRAVPVLEGAVSLALCELLLRREGRMPL